MSQTLDIKGTYFEACNCYAPCSCVCLSPPTEGNCHALVAWHIDSGALGDVALDNLNVVLFAHSPGHMMETPWRVALYLDERASADQQSALGQIYSGKAGGALAALAPLIGEVLGVRTAAIAFSAEGRRHSLRIDGVADVEIESISGQDGGDVTLRNHPFTPVPGETAVVAKSTRFSYTDHGYDRSTSDRNGFSSAFRYSA